jgi:riboflavin synthase alpha subunit
MFTGIITDIGEVRETQQRVLGRNTSRLALISEPRLLVMAFV